MDEAGEPRGEALRVTRIAVRDAARVGGVVGCLLGFLGGVVYVAFLVMIQGGLAGESLLLVLSLPLLSLGVLGVDGVLLGAFSAWGFNLTTRWSGGVALRVERP